MKNKLALITAAAISCTTLGGCIHGSSYSSLDGDYVGKSTFDRIKIGETTESWVAAALGTPSRKTPIEGGSLWAYEYSRTERSKGSVLLVIGGSSSEKSAGGTYVEIKEGIVTDAWRD